jgi:hypothetical protein
MKFNELKKCILCNHTLCVTQDNKMKFCKNDTCQNTNVILSTDNKTSSFYVGTINHIEIEEYDIFYNKEFRLKSFNSQCYTSGNKTFIHYLEDSNKTKYFDNHILLPDFIELTSSTISNTKQYIEKYKNLKAFI